MMDSSEGKHGARLVVFTDLDGTLLDHETYSFAAAGEALDFLRRHKIPVVLCSSKTRAEIEQIQQTLRLLHPFISENGGAIFLPRDYFVFAPDDARSIEGYDVIEFGAPYWRLVEALHRVASGLGVRVAGFSDMSVEEVARDCQLASSDARLAKLREYDEPFRILDSSPTARSRLLEALHQEGLRCTRGGRYYHVTGVADKGLAIRRVKSLYTQAWGRALAVGLGDSLNDLSLLQEVDIPVVVRNPAAGATTRLLRKVPTARVTNAPGPQGWNEAMLEVAGQHVM
jgi:mannosyl-3-phosphoglycerate phosphatase